MLCERCQENNADVLFKQNFNGLEKTQYLCSECAGKVAPFFGSHTGGLDGFPDVFNHMLNGTFAGVEASPKIEKECEVCKSTLSQIRERGRVGCAHCYQTFKEELRPAIAQIQKGRRHRGKVPESYEEEQAEDAQKELLQKELSRALETENYEEAARIRDEMNAIQKGGDSA